MRSLPTFPTLLLVVSLCFQMIGIELTLLQSGAMSQEVPKELQVSAGSIEGVVRYVADPQKPWRLGRYYIKNAKTGEIAEAVVAISKRGLKRTEPRNEVVTTVVDQRDFQFSPETVAIEVGDRIRFLNSDNHPHNVKTSSAEHSFNITMPVGSEHTETFLKSSGVLQPYKIDCVFHSAMRAWVFVFDHPWFHVTGKDGRFLLKDIVPGEYRLEVNHPAGDLRFRQTVTVEAGKTQTIEIRLNPANPKP